DCDGGRFHQGVVGGDDLLGGGLVHALGHDLVVLVHHREALSISPCPSALFRCCEPFHRWLSSRVIPVHISRPESVQSQQGSRVHHSAKATNKARIAPFIGIPRRRLPHPHGQDPPALVPPTPALRSSSRHERL